MSERLNMADKYDLICLEDKIDKKINASCMNLQNATNSCLDSQDIKLNSVENKINIVILWLLVVSGYIVYKR
jgi:hypothetical protein